MIFKRKCRHFCCIWFVCIWYQYKELTEHDFWSPNRWPDSIISFFWKSHWMFISKLSYFPKRVESTIIFSVQWDFNQMEQWNQRFVSAQHTLTIVSIGASLSPVFAVTASIGRMLWSIMYFRRTSPITLSTWIRTLAIFRVCLISKAVFFFLLWMLECGAGLGNSQHCRQCQNRGQLILYHLVIASVKCQFSVRYLSLTLPPHALEIKEVTPCGVTPITFLTVLWCL